MKSLYFREGMRYAILLFAIMAIVGCNFLQKETTSFTLISKENGLIELQTNKYQLMLDSMQIAIQTGKEAVALQFDNSNSVSPIVKNEEVYYEGIYPNTSLRFYEKGEGLAAYDFILQPGANANDICLSLEQNSASINQDGELILSLEEGIIKHSKPYSYQEVNGERVEVESNFLLADNCLSFELGDYDPAYAIVIDPTISFIMMAPSLLLDVSVSNTAPTGDETIQYIFRYRCASITENCLDANISFVVPDALEITSLPLQSGNIHAIAETPVAGGTEISIDLESPPSLNLGSGVLRAGSSGIFSLKVRFKCEDETTAIPGNTVNFVSGPTFSVSNGVGQMITASAPDITVPTLAACAPPLPPSGPGASNKRSFPDFFMNAGPNFYWDLTITPADVAFGEEFVLEEMIPTTQGFLLHDFYDRFVDYSDPSLFELDCGNGYFTIANPTSHPDVFDRRRLERILGQPGDIYNDGNPILDITSQPTGCTYRVVVIDGQNERVIEPIAGNDIKARVTATRTNTTTTQNMVWRLEGFSRSDLMPGDCIQNTMTIDNVTSGAPLISKSDEVCITDKLVLDMRFEVDQINGLGSTDLAGLGAANALPPSLFNLYKDPRDLQARLFTIYNPDQNNQGWDGGLYYNILLPAGWDFVQGGAEPNYQYVSALYNGVGELTCGSTAIFTRTPDYNGTGRTFLEWEIPDCIFDETLANDLTNQAVHVYFSFRYVGTAPLVLDAGDRITLNEGEMGLLDGSPFHYLFNDNDCITSRNIFAQYNVQNPSGSVNSEKFVKGSLDSEFSRFPQFGQTELTGEGEYEFFIYNDGFPSIERLDVVDILPHLNDVGLLTGANRESQWNAELASAVTVERFKAGSGPGTGLIDATADLGSGVMYSSSINPCFLDGALPGGSVTFPGGTDGLMASCDDINSSSFTGARSFAFQWQNAADPLLFGEYIKFTVDIQALTSDPQIANDEIAWNSFAFTAYQQGIGPLLSTEPIKVGIQAFDPNTTAAIGNFVWEDANGNGLQDVGEPVFAGITVSLYDDTGNPVTEIVDGTPVPVTTITDANGEYCFAGLTPNTNYIVRLDNPTNFSGGANLDGYILTTQDAGSQDELDSDAVLANSVGDADGDFPEINASSPAAGEEDKSFDFGFLKLSSVGNFVWNDLNSNGIQDAGEPGIENVTVTLFNQGGSIATDVNGVNLTTTTNASGLYLFEDVLPGTYYVEFGTPAGSFVPTLQGAGGDTNRDSDANADGETALFLVETCDVIRDIDAGFRTPPANPASIAGTVVDDLAKNNQVDATDPGLAGIEVQLLDASQFLLESTTTDANGDYIFENLTPGVTYIIQFIPPSLAVDITFVANGDANTGLTNAITPADNQNVTDVDAGLCGLLSIGNLVFNDPNNNGQLDAGETGISGVDVFLIAQSDGIVVNGVTYNTGDEIVMTTTDANGRYVFKFLPSGTYSVEVVAPGGDLQSSTDIASTPNPNETDSDDNGVGTASTGRISSENITLDIANVGSAGDPNWTEADDAVFIMGMDDPTSNPKAYYTVDFGFFLFDPTPMCPFTCVEGNLLSWADPEWNAGRGWTTTGWVDGDSDDTPADPNNAITTPQIYTNFDGQGNTITATFSGEKPSGSTPGPNIYGATSTNDFGCNNALRMTGAFGTDDPANFPTETITFTNALEFNDFYVGGMRAGRSGTTERAEVSILTFSNGGTPIDPNSFTYTPLNAADVDYQIANNSIYVYGTSTNNDGLLAINLGGVLVDEIVWKVGEIEDNRVTVANFEYTGGQSSQWITPFCYDVVPPIADCECTDFIYVNDTDVGTGITHRFEVDPTDGSVTESPSLWLPSNMTIQNNHGIAQDLNGNLYVAGTSEGDIFRLDAFGNILTPTPWFNNDPVVNGLQVKTINYGFRDNTMYTVSADYRFVVAVDLCTGEILGRMFLYDGVEEFDANVWGFYVDNNKWYAVDRGTASNTLTNSVVYSGPLDLSFYAPISDPVTHAGTALFTLQTPNGSTTSNSSYRGGMGITRDVAGNFYVVENQRIDGGTAEPTIVKYDPLGNPIASITNSTALTAISANGQPGWAGARGITYSPASDKIYVGSKNNCLTVFDTDLTELSTLNIGNPNDGRPKAIGIVTQCCPGTTSQNLENTICYDGTNEETVNLQRFLECEGIITEGDWIEVVERDLAGNPTANDFFTYNACNESVTASGEGCAVYRFSADGNGANNVCGAFDINVTICTTIPPTNDPPVVLEGSCDGNNMPLVDASATINNISNATIAGISSPGTTFYDGPLYNSDPNTSSALFDVTGGTLSLTGLEQGVSYVVRLFNSGNGCSRDVIITTPEKFCTDCDCKDYVYLNEPSTGFIHKFAANPQTGALTEIGSPWYGGTELPSPHGLGVDLNGFLYIGEDQNPGQEIRKLLCDGTLLPESEFGFTSGGQTNIGSIGNKIYYNEINSFDVVEVDVCTAEVTGRVTLDGALTDWGLFVDSRTNKLYSTSGRGLTGDNFLYIIDAGDFSLPATTISPATLNPALPVDSRIAGVTVDENENIYIVVQEDPAAGTPYGTYILKYDVNLDLVATSAVDDLSDGVGFRGTRGIAYSPSTGLLYLSPAAESNVCIAVVDAATLQVVPALTVNGSPGKGIAINTECCPTRDLVLEETVCSTAGEKIFLQDVLNCGEGTICEGMWSVETPNANQVFDDCDLSITINGDGCGVYILEKTTPATGNQQCGTFRIELRVCSEVPELTASVNMATCNGSDANSDGVLTIETVTYGDAWAFVAGDDFEDDGGDTDYTNATPFNPATDLPLAIADDLPNPTGSQDYTIRVFYGSSDCYDDVTVTLNENPCASFAYDFDCETDRQINVDVVGITDDSEYCIDIVNDLGLAAADIIEVQMLVFVEQSMQPTSIEFSNNGGTIATMTSPSNITAGGSYYLQTVTGDVTSTNYCIQTNSGFTLTDAASYQLIVISQGAGSLNPGGYSASFQGTYIYSGRFDPRTEDCSIFSLPIAEGSVTTKEVDYTLIFEDVDAGSTPLIEVNVYDTDPNVGTPTAIDTWTFDADNPPASPTVQAGEVLRLDRTINGVAQAVTELFFEVCSPESGGESLVLTSAFTDVSDACAQFDYGDLPDTYGTSGPNAPCHQIDENLKLGLCVDADDDGQPEAMAGLMDGGDDGDGDTDATGTCAENGADEDGIIFTTPMIPGAQACIDVIAMNMTGSAATLQMWADWNGDGDFVDGAGGIDLGEAVTLSNSGMIPDNTDGSTPIEFCFTVPAAAEFSEGNVFMRFRLSPDGGLAPNEQMAPVPTGEIEDHKLPLAKIGNIVFEDYNFNGIQDAGEPGIDGVTVTLTWGGADNDIATTGDNVEYEYVTGDDATLAAGEYYFCGLTGDAADPIAYKLTYETLTVPGTDVFTVTRDNVGTNDVIDSDGAVDMADLTMAMEEFTIGDVTALPTGENGLSDSGAAGVGTFPDAQVDETHDQGFVRLDYGDLPPNFPTEMADNGAVHTINPNLNLGATIDSEGDGQPEANAEGDGADEDGIEFVTPLIPGATACIEVDAINTTGSAAVLQGWIDWNGNDMLEAGEELTFSNGGTVADGGVTDAQYCFDVPADASFNEGMVFARFRLSENGGLGSDGPEKYPADPADAVDLPIGEVEDYKANVGKLGNLVFEDRNFNGQQDMGEPGIDGVEVQLIWAGSNGTIGDGDDVAYTALTTGSGTFDMGEYYYCGLIEGTYKLVYTTPALMTPTRPNALMADNVADSDGDITGMDLSMAMEEFTITDVTMLPTGESGTGDNGTAPTGTFPDENTDETHDQGFAFLDYGDLPDDPANDMDFPTSMAEGGAVHVIIPDLSLGATVDAEQDGAPSADATGDGADEDGITFATPLIPGYEACISVSAINGTGNDAILQGWIDWDGNNMLDVGEELTFTNGGLISGDITDELFCFDVPATAVFNAGMVFARFRLSPMGLEQASGPDKYDVTTTVPQGEVEDHKINVAKLGNLVWEDSDYDGTQDAGEAGLEGVTVNLEWTNPLGGTEMYTTTTDANGNYYFCGLIPGTYEVSVVDPADLTPSPSNSGNDDFDDSEYPGVTVVIGDPIDLPTGEDGLTDTPGGVDNFPDNQEDISIDFAFVGIDYGDLPDGFNTTQGNMGAAHLMQDGKYLGSCVDAELDGAPIFEATGDDDTASGFSKGMCNGDDDEDGVRILTPLVPGNISCIEVTSTLPAGGGFLNAWVDYNGNDAFEANEQIVFQTDGINGVLPAGTDEVTQLCFMVPADAVFEGLETHLRFRLSCDGNLDPDGLAPDGEVEDYYQPLAKLGDFVWEDVNGNGLQDAGEPGLGGLTVTLEVLDANGNPYQATTTTDANGMYMFFGLLPSVDVDGPYKLTFTSPGADWVATGQDSPVNYGQMGDDTNDSDMDEAMFMVTNITLDPKENDPTIDAGFLLPAELGDLVWLDLMVNNQIEDGLQQLPPELPVEGAKLILTGTDGLGRTVMEMLVSDANGNYLFEDLWPGDYCVEMDVSMITAPVELAPFAAYLVFTYQDAGDDALDSDVNPGNYDSSTGKTGVYNLISQESELTVDGGILIPCLPPSNLDSDNIMLTTATLSWQVNNDPIMGTNVVEHCWNIEIGGAGFAVGNGQAIQAFTVCEGDAGVTITGDMVSIDVSNLIAGTCFDFYVSETCDGFFPGPNNVGWSAPHQFCTFDDPPMGSFTAVSPSCPEASPGFMPDGSFELTVEDGTSCPGGLYDVTIISGPYTVTPPSYLGVPAGNYTFFNAGPGMYEAQIEQAAASICNAKPDLMPVIVNVLVPDAVDMTPPTKFVADVLGTEVTNIGPFDLPEGSCSYQMQLYVSGIDDCDGVISALDAVSASAVTSPATVDPGTQVTVTPDGFGQYLLEVNFSVGTTILTINIADVSGNTTTMTYEVTVNDNINPSVSFTSNQNITIPACLEELEIPVSICIEDACDDAIDVAELTEDFGTATIVSGPTTTNGTCFDYILRVTVANDGDEFSVSYTDGFGNVGTASTTLTVEQAQENRPPVIIAANENVLLEVCDPQAMVYSFQIFDDCEEINTADINFDDGGSGLVITFVDVQGMSVFVEASGQVAAGSYELEIEYQGQTLSPVVEVIEQPDSAPVITMPGNLNFTLPVCQDELTTTLSITIADDCDDPINEGALEVRLCGEIQTAVLLNTQNGGQAYAEYEVSLDAADDGCLLEAIYTDGAGNTTTQSAQISVTQQADNWAPLVIYPSQTIELELDACAEPLGQVCFEITATDNCDGEVAIDLSFSPSLPSGAIMVLPSSGGDTYCIAAEPGSYEVTITATDESGNAREEDFLINITQDARPAVNLACNNNLNITLDEDCQQEITADMLLEGNMGCLIDENFNIVIVDSDITNGNIADGCGEYIYEITLATPPATAGFTGDFAAANWMVVEDNSGFFGPGDAEVSFTNETLSLSTLAGNTASASIVMPTDGDLSFDYTFNGVDVNFDFFIVDVAANEIVNTSLSTSGSFSESVSAGDVIVFTVDDDGFDPFAGPIASEAVVSNWSFAPSSDLDAGDFTTCWGNITLEDKTAPTIVCPEDTDQATVVDDVQLLNGELLITDNGLDISLYPCFLGLSNPPAGTHYYDLFTFTVNADDVYTFDMLSSWGDGAMALYQGDFNAASPCENMIAHSDDALSGTGAFFQAFDPIFRLSLPLQAGQTYTLLATSWPATQTGTYEIAAYSDGAGLLTGVAATQQTVMRDLVCTDWEELLIEDGMYLTDGDGNILTIAPALAEKLSYTGLPEVGDNCGDLKVSIHDSVAENGDCGEVVITRTFTVADKQNSDCAGTPNVEVCTQTISIRKPTTADVVLPPFTVYLECDEGFATDNNGNPHPSVSGYPFVQTAFGLVDLDQSVCNLAANYSDEPGVSTCESGNETRREWTLYNWCDPGSTLIYNQIIKVSDFTAPVVECPFVDYNWDGIGDEITYSTDPFDCTASFQVPLPTVTDNCSSTEVFTQIVTDVEVDVTNQYGQVIGTEIETIVVAQIANNAARFVAGIPVGNHRFRYVVEDGCGNETVLECDFRVVDQIEPVAICDDDLNISIGGQNYARVYAEDIDEGSYDNCGDVTVEVRRQLPNGQFTPWGPHVDFDCVDVNQMVTIELRATDESGLQNVCWLEVLVEDKTRPECIAPHNVDIGCDEVPYDFDPFNTAQLQDLFGEAMATDNCDNATWEELTPIVQLHDCGFGRIIRRFRATDAFGNVSTNSCQQIVTINEVHDYEIKFPRDAEANCGTPSPDTIEYNEIACDLLAVSTEDEFFSASGDECYKIFRTFRVINWCEYDGEADPIVVRRDEDCDGNPGDENVWVLVRSNEVTYYDRDNNEGNTNPFAFTKSPSCDGLTNPTGYWKDSNQDPAISSVGYWQYTQVIKVYDNIKPVITFDATDPFCSIDNVNCDAVVDVPFSVDENCTPDDLTIKVFLDAFADGVIDADLTGTGVLSGTYPDYNIGGEYPIGSHAFEVHVEDGCGNVNSVIIPFSVVDCKAPTPICISGLAIELMPVEDGVDADGDGDVDTGAMAIWASDFIASPVTDCSEPIKYSINRAGDTPVQDQTGITLTCDDDPTTFIEIYAWDSAFNPYAVQPDGTIGGPNYDFCETFVLVQDNMFDLCDTGQGGIAGYIETEDNAAIEGVDVNLSGDMNQFEITGSEGTYTLYGLTANGDYTITPLKDADHKNGVSTFDIVVIMRHILNVQLLDSPYKMIAADVDNSGSISISDLIAIRKLVLSVTDEFENNTSWRFVDAVYNFPEPTNPWLEEFPEIVNINDLEANTIFEGNFVGVKIGDVTGDVQPNSLLQVDDRTNGVLTIQAADQELQSGQEYEVVFTAAELSTIAGYQWTMRFDEQRLELMDVMYANAKAEHFYLGYTDQGLITSSVDLPQGQTKGEELFRLKFRAKANVRLSEALSLNSRLTKVEAYRLDGEKLDVALAFGESQQESGYALYQNVPNPFQAETTIAFELPQAMSATIKVQDITGRTLRIIRGDFAKGYNEIRLTEAQLEVAQSASAVLMYTLETADFTATRKMILLD